MKDFKEFILDILKRASSRSFVVSVVVIYFIATHPELQVEQILGLLVGAGLVNMRAIAEDKTTKA